jgi:hypothetical protein
MKYLTENTYGERLAVEGDWIHCVQDTLIETLMDGGRAWQVDPQYCTVKELVLTLDYNTSIAHRRWWRCIRRTRETHFDMIVNLWDIVRHLEKPGRHWVCDDSHPPLTITHRRFAKDLGVEQRGAPASTLLMRSG